MRQLNRSTDPDVVREVATEPRHDVTRQTSEQCRQESYEDPGPDIAQPRRRQLQSARARAVIRHPVDGEARGGEHASQPGAFVQPLRRDLPGEDIGSGERVETGGVTTTYDTLFSSRKSTL